MASVLSRLAKIEAVDDVVAFANEFGPLGLSDAYHGDKFETQYSLLYGLPTFNFNVREKISDWYSVAHYVSHVLKLIQELRNSIKIVDELKDVEPLYSGHMSWCIGMVTPVFRGKESSLIAHSLYAALSSYIAQVLSGSINLGYCQNQNCPFGFYCMRRELERGNVSHSQFTAASPVIKLSTMPPKKRSGLDKTVPLSQCG